MEIELGPRDLRQLPEYFGIDQAARLNYGSFDIDILAEINHAPRLGLDTILSMAASMAEEGATLIDLGCCPGESWAAVGETVKALKAEGYRVSIDSFCTEEVAKAVAAGAELVLSVNSTNREAAVDWGCEVVVLPDDFQTLAGLNETVDFLAAAGVPLRIDPVIEPIGFGFAASLERYFTIRHRYPEAENDDGDWQF